MWFLLASLLSFALLPNVAFAEQSHHDPPTKTSSSKEPVVSLLMFNIKQQPLSATVVAAERPAGETTFQIRCDSPENPSLCGLKQPTTVRLVPGKSYALNTIQHGDHISYHCKLKSQQPISCTYQNGKKKETFIPGVPDDYRYFYFPVKVTRGAKKLGKSPQEITENDKSAGLQTSTSSADSSSEPTMGATQTAINGNKSGGATTGYEVDLGITLWLTSVAAIGAALIAA